MTLYIGILIGLFALTFLVSYIMYLFGIRTFMPIVTKYAKYIMIILIILFIFALSYDGVLFKDINNLRYF